MQPLNDIIIININNIAAETGDISNDITLLMIPILFSNLLILIIYLNILIIDKKKLAIVIIKIVVVISINSLGIE